MNVSVSSDWAYWFFFLCSCFAWQHFQCVRYGYQIEQLKAEHVALEEQNHQFRLEQAALADPERIDTLARTQLGMVTPNPQQIDSGRRGGAGGGCLRKLRASAQLLRQRSGDIPHEP